MDRVRVQVQFKKFIWTCPACKKEETVDANMDGGNTYERTCSCGKTYNQSCGNMKEYNGCISYTPEEYEALKSADLATKKAKLASEWLYSVKNPPKYVEPTKEELEKMKADKEAEIAELKTQISAKTVEK